MDADNHAERTLRAAANNLRNGAGFYTCGNTEAVDLAAAIEDVLDERVQFLAEGEHEKIRAAVGAMPGENTYNAVQRVLAAHQGAM